MNSRNVIFRFWTRLVGDVPPRQIGFGIHDGNGGTHWHRGRAFGYPLCCRLWYCFVWHPMWECLPEAVMDWLSARCLVEGARYIHCPACIVRGRLGR